MRELETMAQEARKRKLEDSPEVKQMMAIQADSFLANSLAKKISDDTHFTELDLRSYYNEHKTEFEEAEGKHILIRFKGSARAVETEREGSHARKRPWPRRRTFASSSWRAPISPRWRKPNRTTRALAQRAAIWANSSTARWWRRSTRRRSRCR